MMGRRFDRLFLDEYSDAVSALSPRVGIVCANDDAANGADDIAAACLFPRRRMRDAHDPRR
jgi:hypothetical protein